MIHVNEQMWQWSPVSFLTDLIFYHPECNLISLVILHKETFYVLCETENQDGFVWGSANNLQKILDKGWEYIGDL